MCGITGFYSTTDFFSKADLSEMSSALTHRGPDSDGFFIGTNCGLGFRRLSIIDVSQNGNQPMTSQNDRYVIIYNGETYNYKELSALLDKNIHAKLHSTSDTEIILELFAQHGKKFVNFLNGMFSIAIYDKISQELFLFRDRSGIKPLYYYWDGKNFAFASELKSLMRLKQIEKKINPAAIKAYLHLGYIPAPLSAYENIFKMESGSMLTVSSKGISEEKYWTFEDKLNNDLIDDENFASEEFERLIKNSVEIEQRSDVPLGVFLSGGTDSSLIAALASSTRKIKTFSIGFQENLYDESKYSRTVANYLGTEHHEFIVSYKDAISLAEKIPEIYDEPYADSSAIPTYLVSKLTRQYVTVALSGDGADELFHGYRSYTWAKRLSNPVWKISRKPLSLAFSTMSDRYIKRAHLLAYKNSDHLKSHIFSQDQSFFSEPEIENLLDPSFHQGSEVNIFHRMNKNYLHCLYHGYDVSSWKNRTLNSVEEQSLFDIQYYLQDDLLTKIDRASMYHSLEVRVPYLDYRVVEFAINLSPDLKSKNGNQKLLLKKNLYKYLPEDFFNRPKHGFSIPLSNWLGNELKYLIDENLTEKNVNEVGIVNYASVKKYIDLFLGGRHFYSSRLWALIMLHMWAKSAMKNN
jgi:asparagine synthase (glutamine-hydrolysing)